MPESATRATSTTSATITATETETKLERLRDELRRLERVVVAFSGGADSALLAWVANDTLGAANTKVVTAISPSLAPEEHDDCAALAAEWGLDWHTVITDELDNADYRANDGQRCFYCKSALMEALAPHKGQRTITLGVNCDDLGDHRPGQEAAASAGATFPLVVAGLTKADVGQLSRHLGLRTWDKPAAACLASRLPYGTPVTIGTLREVAAAESGLRALGSTALRVRHYGDLARVEVPIDDLATILAHREHVVEAVRAAGYTYVTMDLEGLRSGNLNHALGRDA